jgi:beta-N-acetylhexosaminidase
LAEGQRISDDSITLVRNSGALLPLHIREPQRSRILDQRVKPAHNALLAIILCDNVRANDGRVLETQLRKRVPDAGVIYVDPHSAQAKSEDVLRAVDQAQTVVVAAYVVPSAARTRTVARGQKNSASLPDATAALLDRILTRAAAKTVVLAMGTPYLTEDFPSIQHYICTFSNATVSEISAAKALFGEIPIHGHLPVNIPNVSASSTGTSRPANLSNAGSPY